LDQKKQILSENLYWFANSAGDYTGLQQMNVAQIKAEALKISEGKIEVRISNPVDEPLAFFSRISLVNEQTYERILPVFYSNNYISVLPGEEKTVIIDYTPSKQADKVLVSLKGWNVKEQFIPLIIK
jgi:mannosylglycoprotein endo-beta-mannosidase